VPVESIWAWTARVPGARATSRQLPALSAGSICVTSRTITGARIARQRFSGEKRRSRAENRSPREIAGEVRLTTRRILSSYARISA